MDFSIILVLYYQTSQYNLLFFRFYYGSMFPNKFMYLNLIFSNYFKSINLCVIEWYVDK